MPQRDIIGTEDGRVNPGLRLADDARRGRGIRKAPQAAEVVNRVAARRSIVATREIAAGELLTADNLTVKRPGNGISAARWDEVIGTIARRAYRKDELLEP